MSASRIDVAGVSVSPDHYIDGRRVASDDTFACVSPIDQRHLGDISSGAQAHVDAAVTSASLAFPAWAALGAEGRLPFLRRFAEAIGRRADAFAAVWSAVQGGSGPTDAFRAYLFTVVRRVAAVQRAKGRRAEPTDDTAVLESGTLAAPGAEEPTLAGFERSVVARAFASLPERWQAVLWHSEVEGKTPAEIAPLLGLTANSTAALAFANQNDAEEILSALKAERYVTSAALYDKDGKLFSKYPANLPDRALPVAPRPNPGRRPVLDQKAVDRPLRVEKLDARDRPLGRAAAPKPSAKVRLLAAARQHP